MAPYLRRRRRRRWWIVLLGAHPGHHLPGDGLRYFLVRTELHRVRSTTLGPRTQVGSVAEHIGQRDQRVDHMTVAPLVHALYLAPSGGKVADDVAHVVLG